VEGGGRTWGGAAGPTESQPLSRGLGLGTYTIRETVPMNYRLLSIEPATVTITVDDLNGYLKLWLPTAK